LEKQSWFDSTQAALDETGSVAEPHEKNESLPEATTKQGSAAPPEPLPEPARDPYRRACEFEPGYDWRTDPYYDEQAIRARLYASKQQIENET